MAKARVELLKSLSHTARGRRFERNKPQYITVAADILYYQQQAEFSVVIVEEDKPAPPPVARVKAVAPAPKAPVQTEPEDVPDDLEEDEAPEDDGEADLQPPDDEEEAEVAAPAKAKPGPKGPFKKKTK